MALPTSRHRVSDLALCNLVVPTIREGPSAPVSIHGQDRDGDGDCDAHGQAFHIDDTQSPRNYRCNINAVADDSGIGGVEQVAHSHVEI